MVQYQTKHLISHHTEVPVAIVIIEAAIFIIQRKGLAEAGDLVWNGASVGPPATAARTQVQAVVCPFH